MVQNTEDIDTNRAQTRYQTVRPSLRTHQNFEAATRYKTRTIKIKVTKLVETAKKVTPEVRHGTRLGYKQATILKKINPEIATSTSKGGRKLIQQLDKVEKVRQNTYDLALRTMVTILRHSTYTHMQIAKARPCLLYTSPSPRDMQKSRMPSSA